MKILKYILLLLLLVFIASSVFVATLKPDYSITRSAIVKSSKVDVFNYINNFKNWPEFGQWKKDDATTKSSFSKNTSGKSAFYSWQSQDSDGKITTLKTVLSDSIHQKMNFNDADSDVYWNFKTVASGTKITWTNVGKMSFTTKIFTSIMGGMDNIVGDLFEQSINNIGINLKKNISIHSITEDGFIETTMGMYLQKTINSTNENVESNIQIMIPNLLKYLKSRKIIAIGKPFVKYNYRNLEKGTTCISVCSPIKDSIFTNTSSEYTFANMLPFQAMKVTLNGNLANKPEAKIKILELIAKNNLDQKTEQPIIEVYKVSKKENADANKWITEIYYPIKKKGFTKKYVKPISSYNNSTVTAPETTTLAPAANEPKIEPIIIKKDRPQ